MFLYAILSFQSICYLRRDASYETDHSPYEIGISRDCFGDSRPLPSLEINRLVFRLEEESELSLHWSFGVDLNSDEVVTVLHDQSGEAAPVVQNRIREFSDRIPAGVQSNLNLKFL